MKESACKMVGLCYNKDVPSYLDKRQMNAFQTCSGAVFEEENHLGSLSDYSSEVGTTPQVVNVPT